MSPVSTPLGGFTAAAVDPSGVALWAIVLATVRCLSAITAQLLLPRRRSARPALARPLALSFAKSDRRIRGADRRGLLLRPGAAVGALWVLVALLVGVLLY